jgi:hypothetical protein
MLLAGPLHPSTQFSWHLRHSDPRRYFCSGQDSTQNGPSFTLAQRVQFPGPAPVQVSRHCSWHGLQMPGLSSYILAVNWSNESLVSKEEKRNTYPTLELQLGMHWSPNLNLAHERQSLVAGPQQPSVLHCELQTWPCCRQLSGELLLWICGSILGPMIFFQLIVSAKQRSTFSMKATVPDRIFFNDRRFNDLRLVFTT